MPGALRGNVDSSYRRIRERVNVQRRRLCKVRNYVIVQELSPKRPTDKAQVIAQSDVNAFSREQGAVDIVEFSARHRAPGYLNRVRRDSYVGGKLVKDSAGGQAFFIIFIDCRDRVTNPRGSRSLRRNHHTCGCGEWTGGRFNNQCPICRSHAGKDALFVVIVG